MSPSQNTDHTIQKGYAQMMGETLPKIQIQENDETIVQDTVDAVMRSIKIKTKIITSYEV